MGLVSVFRRVWPQQQRYPPRRPRTNRRPHQLDQEQLVIASYRHHLFSLAQILNTKWAAFDAEPDDFKIVHQLRHLRQQLTTALESYHAALGAVNNTAIAYVINTMQSTDQRLVSLDEQVLAEVQRFEYASLDIASRYDSAINPASRVSAAADANDVLIELELYHQTWSTIMDSMSRNRLDYAHALLREIIEAQPPTTSSNSLDFRTSAPQSFQSNSNAPGAWPPATPLDTTPPDRPRPRRSNRHYRKHPSPPPPPIGASSGTTTPDRDYGSSESGDDEPMRMVISRSRTLRDVVADVMSTTEQDSRMTIHSSIPSSAITSSHSSSMDQPNISGSKNMSFASTLYHTRHARVDAISDSGIILRRSNVRGDGRCMFRALARGRIVATGSPIPSEKVEKDAADDLRARAVAELRKQRTLLAKFFVIEGDFDQYTRKMSNSRTYGGEPELLMLAKLLHVPIAVYIQKDGAYRQIQVYGKQYRGDPLRIVYSDGVHYDALLANR